MKKCPRQKGIKQLISKQTKKKIDREKDSQRERKEKDRAKDRHRERQTERNTDREKDKEKDRQAEERQTERKTRRKADRDWQTERNTDRMKDKEKDRQKKDRQRETQRERQTEIGRLSFFCLSVFLFVFFSVCLSLCLSFFLSFYLFVFLSKAYKQQMTNSPEWQRFMTRSMTKLNIDTVTPRIVRNIQSSKLLPSLVLLRLVHFSSKNHKKLQMDLLLRCVSQLRIPLKLDSIFKTHCV